MYMYERTSSIKNCETLEIKYFWTDRFWSSFVLSSYKPYSVTGIIKLLRQKILHGLPMSAVIFSKSYLNLRVCTYLERELFMFHAPETWNQHINIVFFSLILFVFCVLSLSWNLCFQSFFLSPFSAAVGFLKDNLNRTTSSHEIRFLAFFPTLLRKKVH